MPPSPMAKTIVAVVQDTDDCSVTDAEMTTQGLDLIPPLLKPPLSARSVLAN